MIIPLKRLSFKNYIKLNGFQQIVFHFNETLFTFIETVSNP